MRYAGGTGVINAPERRAVTQQPRRFVKGTVIRLPGDGRFEIQGVTGMVGNVGKGSSFVEVSMVKVGTENVIVRPMAAQRFVEVVSVPKGKR
jgi:hypothetical protein